MEYTTVEFPLGRIVIRYGGNGQLESIEFDLEKKISAIPGDSALERGLEAYLEGETRSFDIDLDFSHDPPFFARVWREVRRIPVGKVATYGEIAANTGSPDGARAVGNAMAANRYPIIVPCHRVVGAGGKLGGFSSGRYLKRWLLSLEGSAC